MRHSRDAERPLHTAVTVEIAARPPIPLGAEKVKRLRTVNAALRDDLPYRARLHPMRVRGFPDRGERGVTLHLKLTPHDGAPANRLSAFHVLYPPGNAGGPPATRRRPSGHPTSRPPATDPYHKSPFSILMQPHFQGSLKADPRQRQFRLGRDHTSNFHGPASRALER